MKSIRTILAVLSIILFPAAARAQNGCVNSPENATIILALIGSAAATIPALRRRRPTIHSKRCDE